MDRCKCGGFIDVDNESQPCCVECGYHPAFDAPDQYDEPYDEPPVSRSRSSKSCSREDARAEIDVSWADRGIAGDDFFMDCDDGCGSFWL